MENWLDERQNQSRTSWGPLLNIFSGGGIQNCAIFGLGIMPYISASIMMQLLTAVVPKLNKLAREDGGRQKDQPDHAVCSDRALSTVQGYFMVRWHGESLKGNFLLQGLDESSQRPDRSDYW